jgi:ABC-type antimicrobial peptide transport system permease subunit
MLPWEYGVRNLARRPLRTLLTLAALAIVVLLVFVVVGFIRGLERSLSTSGDADVVLVYSIAAEENIESSSINASVPALVGASVRGTFSRFGVEHISPELFMGTKVQFGADLQVGFGLVRGVSDRAPLVRRKVRLTSGHWPQMGEVMVGKLVSAKLGAPNQDLAVGQTIRLEGRDWKISGEFVAEGGAFESEIWCPLESLQTATQRQDLSLVAFLLAPEAKVAELQMFCKQRTDLEIRAQRETDYYATLQQHYGPMKVLAWMVVGLVSGSGVFARLNMMYGAVAGRVREIATLQALGFRRRAILISLVQEGILLALSGSLIAGFIALVVINGLPMRFTMGAFALRIDGVAILIGSGVGLLLGGLGALPPAMKALRASVATSLKAI